MGKPTAAIQGRSVNRGMLNRSDLIMVQKLPSTEQNGLLLTKIEQLIVQRAQLIVQ